MRRPHEGDQPSSAATPLAPYAAPTYQIPTTGAYVAGPPVAPPPAARGVPTFLGLLNALKRRWVLACFLGLLAGLAAAAGLWLGMPEGKHQVKGLLEVVPLKNAIAGLHNIAEENSENFKKNQEVLIRTRSLLRQVAENQRVAPLPLIANSDDPAKTVDELLRTRWEAPDVMAVMMNGNNPEQLRIILDELMKAFTNASKHGQQRDREQRMRVLEEAREKIKKRIESYERLVKQVNNDGIPIGPEGTAALIKELTQQQGQLTQELGDYRKRINTLEEQLRLHKNKLDRIDAEKIPDALIDTELSKDPTTRAMQSEIETEQRQLAAMVERIVVPNDPTVVRYQQRLKDHQAQYAAVREKKRAEAEQRIRAENKAQIETARKQAADELEVNKGLQARTEEMYEQISQKIKEIAVKNGAVELGADELKPLKEQMVKISGEILDLDIASHAEGRIQVREDAQVILNHNLKQKMVFSAVVAVGAFLAVLALVAYLEWRSRRVDGVEQVVNEIGLRVLGTIPAFPSRASLKAGEADQNQNWRFILNESVNSTRTMLLHTAKSQSMQVIMVTSAMQGEGKTSLASQLATSMATAGLRTLILDFDLRNPSMHRLFEVGLTPGASEVLLQEVDVSDAVQPTSVPNLWMIPAGQCSNRVVASLAQGHPLETLFNRLRGQFDFIVVDCCPVLPVADALLIGQHVDGVVISILQDISQLPKVLNASERLSLLNIPLLGAVVNGIKTDIHAYGYNYVKQLPA